MGTGRLDPAAVERLHRRAHADRWAVSRDAFAEALERSVRRALPGAALDAREAHRYLDSLHLEDLALAVACAGGHAAAWDYFVREFRPILYRAADAIDPSGGAREVADSLYAELYGLSERDGERRSHFKYFHGRSSLATWLRAVLSQRHVDRVRSGRKLDPLPADEAPDAIAAPARPADLQRSRSLAVMRRAITTAVAALAPRDRLRLACYYAQSLTLAQIGRILGEHEATVSRQLTRARRAVRAGVEQELHDVERMTAAEIAECFASVVDDPGSLDVTSMLGAAAERKEVDPDRSM